MSQLDPLFVRTFQNHRHAINWISFSPNGEYLASVSDDRSVVVNGLSDESNNLFYKFSGHSGVVTSVAMTNTFLVSASKDCTAKLWRLDQSEGIHYTTDANTYRCHQSPINCVDISYDQMQFCTASDDRMIKLWSTSSTNKLMQTLSGEHSNWIRHARFAKLNAYLLASAGDDSVICIWDLRAKQAAIRLASKRRSTHFLGVQWHPTCEYFISSSSSDCLIRVWDLRFEKTIQCYQIHDGFVSSTDFHPNGTHLISSSTDHTCKLIDLLEGKTLVTLRAHHGAVNCAKFSPNGEYFATAGQDHTVIYWKSNLRNDDTSDDDDIRSISFEPDIAPINHFDSADRFIRKSSQTKSKLNGKSVGSSHSCKMDTKSTLSSKDASTLSSSSDSDYSVSILKGILQQVEVITDSVLSLEQRLNNLEDKFDKLHF